MVCEHDCASVSQVRGLFKELNVDAKFFELDEMGESLGCVPENCNPYTSLVFFSS